MARSAFCWSGSLISSTSLVGGDLPGDAELVLQPAAGALLAAALGERVPVVVDLGLVVAADLEGDGLVELELRAAVEGEELLAVGLELDGQYGTRAAGPRLGVAGDRADAGSS